MLPGILVRDWAGMILEASSTVTLIQTFDKKYILVDTSDRSRQKELISALKDKADIEPADIDYLVSTHRHPDHIGNNDLFKNAKWYAHPAEYSFPSKNRPNPEPAKEGYALARNPRVYIIETPGHTLGSITVIVESDDIYAITGDALPLEDNYHQWVPPGININPFIALKSMERIVKLADYVIPGHDRMFKIE
jgi:glyoxylase-like metal-dependent hydrolase (beta-lactamase superfamily II)